MWAARTSVRCIQAQEGRALAGCFHGGAALRFFAFDEADGGDYFHAGASCGLDGGDGGGSGGADIVDDEDGCVFLEEAFDAAAGAVSLFGFADKKAMDQVRAVMLLRVPGAGGGHVGDDGIGAEGESADGCRFELLLTQQIEDGEAGEASAFSVKRGGAAVNVVVALAAGGEREVAELEGDSRKQVEQGCAVVGHLV